MSYELEYTKSYDGTKVIATPIAGHPNLPVLTVEATPEEADSVVFKHRTRWIGHDSRGGITALVFGKPGNIRVVHHDREVLRFDSHDEAMNHHRPGEHYVLLSAHDNNLVMNPPTPPLEEVPAEPVADAPPAESAE